MDHLRPSSCVIAGVVVAGALLAACGSTDVSQIAGPGVVACQVSAAAPEGTLSAAGERISVPLSTSRDCVWTADTAASWLQISPQQGQGEGALAVTAAPNPSQAARIASITVNETRVTVRQAAAPPPPPSPAPIAFEPDPPAPAPQPSTPAPQPPAPSPQPSTPAPQPSTPAPQPPAPAPPPPTPAPQPPAPAPAPPTPQPPGPPTPQPPAPVQPTCSPSVSPRSITVPSSGGSGQIAVTLPAACSWTASATPGWIQITFGSSGTGTGTVRFEVNSYRGRPDRTGTITVAGVAVALTQRGTGD